MKAFLHHMKRHIISGNEHKPTMRFPLIIMNYGTSQSIISYDMIYALNKIWIQMKFIPLRRMFSLFLSHAASTPT